MRPRRLRLIVAGLAVALLACVPTDADLAALRDQGCREQGGRPYAGYCLSRPDTSPDWRAVRDCTIRLRAWATSTRPAVEFTDRQFQVACGGL